MKPGVSIVIPTWNGLALLARFLPSVLAAGNRYHELSGAAVEVIIVDDASTDQTTGWLIEHGFRESGAAEEGSTREAVQPGTRSALKLEFARNEVNLGFGETCNRGFAAATQPLVFLVNNDVEVCEEAIAPLVENFIDSSVFAAHCRVSDLSTGKECGTGKLGGFSRGFFRVHQSYACRNNNLRAGPLHSMFAGGGSAMFDRRKFQEIGGFDPLFSPFYWEDVELSYRAWKRGFTVLYEPRSATRHRLSSTIGGLKRRSVRLIEQRNRLIYHWIHLQDRGLMASHIAWLFLLAVTAPLRFNPGFIASFAAALKRMPAIRKRRLEERDSAKRTDREVFRIFEILSTREDVVVYDGKQGQEAEEPPA